MAMPRVGSPEIAGLIPIYARFGRWRISCIEDEHAFRRSLGHRLENPAFCAGTAMIKTQCPV
jgi:hypothetical protein